MIALLMSACGSIASESAPPATAAATDPAPAPPIDRGPQPVASGDALPTTLVGRAYRETETPAEADQRLVLRLRAADDPHCTAMFNGESTCFTILWEPNVGGHRNDPGARGAAVMRGDQLILAYRIVPFDTACEGLEVPYSVENGTLTTTADPGCGFSVFEPLPDA